MAIKEAGLGVAMANAEPAVKAAADYITTSNDEEGVAKAIEKFALKKITQKRCVSFSAQTHLFTFIISQIFSHPSIRSHSCQSHRNQTVYHHFSYSA